jgi:ATP-dependent Clp protease ATP-binding subunit ClpC
MWNAAFRKQTAFLNEEAHAVLLVARGEAMRRNQNYVGVEHVLLGLTRQAGARPSVVTVILRGRHEEVARQLGEFMAGAERVPPEGFFLTPRMVHILRLAPGEADLLGQRRVGPEHLLLAILREGRSMPAGILQLSHITLEESRVVVERMSAQRRY